MIPAMEVPRNYSGQQLMYSHNQAQTQSERPFKYDNMPSPNQYSHQPQQQHQQQQPDRSFKYDMTTPTYRQYQPQHQPYQPLPGMGSPIMSNIHQPGGQMSMIPAMGVPQGYNGQPIYRHNQPQPQSERPFKCDQCVQSFSRNHDLKRHKRIHLAVKPFPCSFCSKSFSRKDALKVRTLFLTCFHLEETLSTFASPLHIVALALQQRLPHSPMSCIC